MDQVFINWSGGKDACLSLQHVLEEGRLQVAALLTTLSEPYRRVSMHGVCEELLRRQAESLGIPLRVAFLPENVPMETYAALMEAQTDALKADGMTGAVFGDIFLEDVRRYREQQLGSRGIRAIFPLWGQESLQVARDFIGRGFRAVVCCVNAALLDESFAGRDYDAQFLADLPPGVDPAGERGEFHTFVHDGPLFLRPVAYRQGAVVEKSYAPSSSGHASWETRYFFRDLLPADR